MFILSWLQGLPFPSNEFNAIDVVVRYSVSELGFAFEDIILLAWSIGKADISLSTTVFIHWFLAHCMYYCMHYMFGLINRSSYEYVCI